MIGRDDPAPVGLTVDAARPVPNRFETPNMALCECLSCVGIMAQMQVDRIMTVIGCGDLGDGAIDVPDAASHWGDPNDGVLGNRLDRVATTDIDIVAAPVDPVDQQIVAVAQFIGEATSDHAPDDGRGFRRGGIKDALLHAFPVPRVHLALQGADDVTALSERAQSVFEIVGELPAPTADRLREPQLFEFAQSARPQRLLERVEIGKQSPMSPTVTLTPQIQMVYAHVGFDRFTAPSNTLVMPGHAGSLKSCGGMSIDHQRNWEGASGGTRRSHLYALANLSYEWLDGTRVDVSGTPIVNRDHRLSGELSLGGSYSWDDGRFTLYSEVSADTALAQFGESYSVKGNAGFRVRFQEAATGGRTNAPDDDDVVDGAALFDLRRNSCGRLPLRCVAQGSVAP